MLEDRLKLRLPMLGGLFARAALARFMRTLATLLDAGLPAIEALDGAAGAAGAGSTNRPFGRPGTTWRRARA